MGDGFGGDDTLLALEAFLDSKVDGSDEDEDMMTPDQTIRNISPTPCSSVSGGSSTTSVVSPSPDKRGRKRKISMDSLLFEDPLDSLEYGSTDSAVPPLDTLFSLDVADEKWKNKRRVCKETIDRMGFVGPKNDTILGGTTCPGCMGSGFIEVLLRGRMREGGICLSVRAGTPRKSAEFIAANLSAFPSCESETDITEGAIVSIFSDTVRLNPSVAPCFAKMADWVTMRSDEDDD